MSNLIMTEGKYKLLSLTMSAPNNRIDLSPYAARCDIFESILSPSVICELVISDATGMINSFNFTEQDLFIEFTTHESVDPVSYKFSILDLNPVKTTPNDKTVVFTLTCVSKEAIKNKTIKNVPLVRQNVESHRVVASMLNLLNTEKNVFLEKTNGMHTFALTKINPFDAIDNIRKSAISANYDGSAFVFFENNKGYHFKSLEGVIEEGLQSIGDKHFIHTGLAGEDVQGTKWRNILAYKVIQNGNRNVALTVGGFNNSVRRYNIETGELEFFEKNANQVDFVTMNEGSIAGSAEQQTKHNQDEGNIEFSLYNPEQENNMVAEKQNFLPYYISQFLNIISHITIYGDSTITVGDMISCQIPQNTGLSLSEDRPYVEDDVIMSGNYLVCKCRHVLTFGNFPEYYQGLEIIKDGYGGKLQGIHE